MHLNPDSFRPDHGIFLSGFTRKKEKRHDQNHKQQQNRNSEDHQRMIQKTLKGACFQRLGLPGAGNSV